MPCYRIAGLTVAMNSFGRIVRQAAPYLCDDVDPAGAQIVIPEGGWKRYLELYPDMGKEMSEYIMTGQSFYRQLLDFDGMKLHASAVVKDGRAYLFTANSGTGKSTHTQLWLDAFGDAFILNDDKPALRRESDGWFAYGTPWSGKVDLSVNARVPLGGIAIVERAEENSIEPCRGVECTRELLRQVNRPRAAEYRVKLMELLDRLITETPIWKLRCNTQPQAALVAWETMSKGRML